MQQSTDLLSEATRQLEVCNSCRYCEGFCAVFPALERQPEVVPAQIGYLANLCHDCRACYYACPFTEPHEFAINIPLLMANVRQDVYRRYTWPRLFAGVFQNGFRFALPLIAFGLALAAAALFALHPASDILTVRHGTGSFYQVLPWLLLVIPAMLLSLYALVVICIGGFRFWRDSRGLVAPPVDVRIFARAVVDVLRLRWLEGGGDGCYYPADRPSRLRTVFHSLVFYGFGLALLSTSVAALYQDVLGRFPPYPLLSVPVVAGTLGGLAMVFGCIGLALMKRQSAVRMADPSMTELDYAFLTVLGLASLTGLMTLALRDTALMGVMLSIHVGTLGALYLTIPYGKLIHPVYRGLAILRNRLDQQRDVEAASPDDRRHVGQGVA
jgi:citrate/tricarballylate utilization protein